MAETTNQSNGPTIQEQKIAMSQVDQARVRIKLIDHIASALCHSELTANGRRYLKKLKEDCLKTIEKHESNGNNNT